MDDSGIYGGIVNDTFFVTVGRNKRRMAQRFKFLIREQALRTRAVDLKPASPSHPDGIADVNTVSRHASPRLRSEMRPKLSFL